MFEAIKKATPLNWELIGNPVNWAIVLLMAMLGGIMVSLIFQKNTEVSSD